MRPDRLSRRAVLLGTAGTLLGVSACQGARVTPAPDPDIARARAALAGERELIDAYAATLARHPGLSARLSGFAAEHRAHADALASALPATGSASSSPAPSSPARTTPGPAAPPVPATPAGAVSALAALERARADALAAATAPCAPLVARLLASIGGAEASHAALLTSPGSVA